MHLGVVKVGLLAGGYQSAHNFGKNKKLDVR